MVTFLNSRLFSLPKGVPKNLHPAIHDSGRSAKELGFEQLPQKVWIGDPEFGPKKK
tara:strand:- start:1113 stop:1280 length:168 start_codon:yes stop_codon:yes gene_type:complete